MKSQSLQAPVPTLTTTTMSSLGSLGAAWDHLVDVAPLPSPFLRSWWLEACSTSTGRFVVVSDGDGLVGGAFVEKERRHRATRLTIGAGGRLAPDHLDLVAQPGREGEVAAALGRWIAERKPCTVEVPGAREGASICAALPHPAVTAVVAPAPYAALPDDPDAYLGARPSWLRHTVRRGGKRLDRDGVRYGVVDGDDVERALGDLRRLHEERWAAPTNFLSSYGSFADAVRSGVRHGEVVLHELTGPDGVVASMVTFEVGGRVSFYQSGRSTEHRWRSAGSVLMARVIERACEHGMREFDFLRGGEAYKASWSTGSRDVLHLRAASGAWPRALLAGLTVRDAGRRAAVRAVRRRRATS